MIPRGSGNHGGRLFDSFQCLSAHMAPETVATREVLFIYLFQTFETHTFKIS